MAGMIQNALVINFLLDAIVFVLLLTGHELVKEITTHGIWRTMCPDSSDTMDSVLPSSGNGSCAIFLRLIAQFVLFFGIVRLAAGLFPSRGTIFAAWMSYFAEFMFFTGEIINGTVDLSPRGVQSAECLKPPYNGFNACGLRTCVGALAICAAMMYSLLMWEPPRASSAAGETSEKKKTK